MAGDALLSELCSICYANKPKYRCPRCNTRTCSLPCSMKHKQRASCSGKRNPAEFVKKRQLATPAGVDRDYNYLKSVERSIDVAGRDIHDRGIGKPGYFKGQHPESILQKYLVANRITMHRAPAGMSRQKFNQTRASKRNHVLWTVEWIDAEARQSISNSCLESGNLRDLYATTQLDKHHASKRRPGASERAASKRRRSERMQYAASEAQAGAVPLVDEQKYDKTDDVQPALEDDSSKTEIETVADATAECEKGSGTSATQLHFYLLRPGTRSSSKVLIPADAAATLTATLQDKTVMEFPTIYVLPHAPEQLPTGFMLEHTYLEMRKAEHLELDDAIRRTDETGALEVYAKPEAPASNSNVVDPSKILDMLKRDVTR